MLDKLMQHLSREMHVQMFVTAVMSFLGDAESPFYTAC